MPPIPQTARAIICPAPGPPSVLRVKSIPVPVPQPGQVLLRVLGFGINRAEMFTRQGHSPGLKFPLIMGIECIGRVVAYNNTTATTTTSTPSPPTEHKIAFHPGDLVATCMGGLGRQIPGSYQEYTCVLAANLRPIPLPPPSTSPSTAIKTSTLAALPEMFQTTWGALTTGLDVQPGESVLVRGATSSIGLCALQLLKVKLGASRVGATTRNPDRVGMLRDAGADVVFIDNDNKIADQVANGKGGAEGGEQLEDARFDKCLELIGTKTFLDSAACLKPKGTLCMTGIQGGEWELERFNPMTIPNRVRVCGYGGGPEDFHAMPWEELVNDVVQGRIKVPVKEYTMDDIQTIHENMEAGGGGAKMVVVLGDL